MAWTGPFDAAAAEKPPESAAGNPTVPDPPATPNRDDESPEPTSEVVTPSGDSDASATGTAGVPYAYPPPLPFRSSGPKKRRLWEADERGYREKSMRPTWGGLRLPAAGFGAATRVPPDERSRPHVDYSKLTPLAGSREPSSRDDKEKAPQIVVVQPKGFDERCPAQMFALQLSTVFIRLLNPQAVSSAATGGDLAGGLDDEAIDNLLNEEGMEVILKTSIPTVYSKEILYEILMECIGRYPKWLEDNKDKVVKEKHEQYQKQFQLMVRLALVYDKEPGNLSNIMKLMYKIGEYGPPPSGIINAISPRLYQSIMKQLAAAGVVDIVHDKVLQPTKVQTKGLHEGCSAQRLAGQVSTEFMRRLDPQVGSGFAAGRGVDISLVQDAINNLLNREGRQVNVKETLDELQMEFVGQYSKWADDNKHKVGKEEDEQYQKQLRLVVRLTTVYDEEPENYSKIMKLLYEIRECGPPLSDVIHAISSPLYQSTMVQHTAVGVADVLHDKVPQVIEIQTKGLHEGCSAQRLVGQVSTEFMQPLDPEAGSGTAAGDLDGKLLQDAIVNLLNGEGMQDIAKTSIPKVYSKEVLYELIKEFVGQYPKWLEDNKDKLDKENYEQYLTQLEFMVNLNTVYDEEPENFSKIMKLVYKIGKYGRPPSGVIHAVSRLYQSTKEQLAAVGAVDVLHDKVPQVIKVQAKGLHEGCSAQRLVGHGKVSTEFMRLLGPEVGSGAAAGNDLDGKLVHDANKKLLNGESMQGTVKTWIPKVYSKEVHYELIMAYVGQYPKWLEDNKDKLDKENHEQYMVQFQFMVDLTNVYEEEPENFSKIMKLMYKIRKYGPPPSGVIDAVSPRLYQSTMEQLCSGMVELLQDLDKLFRVDTSPSTTPT